MFTSGVWRIFLWLTFIAFLAILSSMNISGKTKTVGLIGDPVSHSVSPQMHNAAFKKLDLDYCYIAMQVDKNDLKKALDGIRAENFAGVNVTVPHKEAVIPLLDEVTKLPRLIGAVNTIKNEGGKLIGYNTDGAGFIESLKEDAKVDPKGKKVVLIGAGGGAKAVAIMLAESGTKSLSITDIAADKASALSSYVKSHFEIEADFVPHESKDLRSKIQKCDILINATPVGMHPNEDKCPLSEDTEIPKGILVCDLIYNPPETKFLKKAKGSGAKILNGIGMLVRQGALAFEIFTEKEAPVEVMRSAVLKSLNLT